MEPIVLHVTYTGTEGRAAAFASAMCAGALRDAVRAEDGCLRYDYYLPVGGDGNTALLIECWRDQAALDRHSSGAAMAQLKALKASYDLTTEIQRIG